MSKVYSQARLVVVWLGEENPTTGLAFGLMHEWQMLSTASEGEAVDKTGEFWKRVEAELKSPTLAALASLLQRRWFRRVWIIQEVVMAADAMVVCGSHSICWTTLDAFIDALDTQYFAISLATAGGTKEITGKSTVRRIKALKEGIKSGTVYSFLDILSVTRDLQATDPRDKIYSLFSLVKGTHMPTPDYNILADDLFRDTNISILREDPNLDILSFFDYRTLDPRPNVATWMPNWISVNMKRNPLWGCEDIYAITGELHVQYTISEDFMSLTLRGIIYDEVDLTGYEYDVSEASEASAIHDPLERSRQALIFLKSCESIAKGSVPSSYSGQSFEEAFARTMVCNMTSTGERVAPDISKSYEAYMEVLDMFSQKRLAKNIDELMLKAFPFENATAAWVSDRVFCRTRRGYMGMIPSVSAKGDVVCAFLGGRASFIIRPKADGFFQLIGACYIHGMMSGELLELPNFNQRLEDITLR
jgi:hypothetical protein